VIAVTSGAAFGPSGRWESTDAAAEFEAAEAEVAVCVDPGLLLGVLGCDFHQPPLLAPAETERAMAVASAITTINNVADLFLLSLEFLR